MDQSGQTRISGRLARAGQAFQQALSGHEPKRLTPDHYKPASVLVPVWDDGQAVCLVFTMRSAALPQHAGQISFPGGGMEPGDPDRLSTALRETQEEIGVEPASVEVLARLDQTVTVTDYLVTPYLATLNGVEGFQPNPVEVARMITVPLNTVLDIKNYRTHTIWWQGHAFNNLALEYQGDLIWGATARMLLDLLAALGDRTKEIIQAARG